jgi:hypothetical protein
MHMVHSIVLLNDARALRVDGVTVCVAKADGHQGGGHASLRDSGATPPAKRAARHLEAALGEGEGLLIDSLIVIFIIKAI